MAFATIDVTKGITGTIPVANGGTGVASGTTGQFLKFTGTTTLASAAVETGALLSGQKTSNGGTGNGSGVDMLTSDSINLSSYQNKHLIVHGQTAISENSNTANTIVLRIELSNGSTVTTLSSSRQGMGAYGGEIDGNRTNHISAAAVYQIPSAYATTCTLRLNGGVNSGDFTYGDQTNYNYFDGEGAGIGIRFFVI